MPEKKESCPRCGLPRSLARKLVWTTDGGIYFPEKHSERHLFLEIDDISLILKEAERICGEKILDRLRELRRRFSRYRTMEQAGNGGLSLSRHRPLAGGMVKAVLEEASFFGAGGLEVAKIKPGKRLEVKAIRPYHPQLLAGDLWGFWEGFFGVRADMELETTPEGGCRVSLESVEKKRWGEGDGKKRAGRPERDYELEVCEKCRLPLFPWELRWDRELGTIYQPGTRRHFILTPVEGWRLVMGEIAHAAGENFAREAGRAMREKAREEWKEAGERGLRKAYRDFFTALPVLGWGKPVRVSRKPFLMEARLSGVPFPLILAWKMEGAFEALEKEPGDVEWRREGGSDFVYLLGPRLEGSFLSIDELRGSLPPRNIFPTTF